MVFKSVIYTKHTDVKVVKLYFPLLQFSQFEAEQLRNMLATVFIAGHWLVSEHALTYSLPPVHRKYV